MSDRIKEISQYSDGAWESPIPIGADAENIDVNTQDGEVKDLQSILGTPSKDISIQEQLNGKINSNYGDVGNTVINTDHTIPMYDFSTEETSTDLIARDETDMDVVVTSGESETLTTMWGKFNRFRKRVDNKIKNFFVNTIQPDTSMSDQGYSTTALNNYFKNVIGYKSISDITGLGSVASQLQAVRGAIYIKSRETRQGWDCVTWSNGLKEAWRRIEYSAAAFSQTGSVYQRTFSNIALPTGFFEVAPFINVTPQLPTMGIGAVIKGAPTKTSFNVVVIAPTATSQTATLMLYARTNPNPNEYTVRITLPTATHVDLPNAPDANWEYKVDHLNFDVWELTIGVKYGKTSRFKIISVENVYGGATWNVGSSGTYADYETDTNGGFDVIATWREG